MATPSFEDAVAEQTERGKDLVLSGTFSGIDLAYLPTGRDLGVITEIFGGMPEAEQEPDT